MIDSNFDEAEEVLEGEVIRNGDGEEDSGPGNRVRKRNMFEAPEEMGNSSSFPELGTIVGIGRRFLGGCVGFRKLEIFDGEGELGWRTSASGSTRLEEETKSLVLQRS